jgi:protein-tyrosine-phosphatase
MEENSSNDSGVMFVETRKGKIKYMAKSLLFVCTFNAGRSVASEYLFRHMLRERDERLDQLVRISSAGLVTKEAIQYLKDFGLSVPKPFFGRPPHRYMITLMARRGIDVTGHRSRGLNRVMLHQADLVVVFGERLRAAMLSFWPEAEERVFGFKEFVGDEYLLSETAGAAPYADGDFVDYDIDEMAPFIAEIERCLAQTTGKFLRHLQFTEAL